MTYIIGEKQLEIVEALARYKFLTVSLIEILLQDRTKRQIQTYVRQLISTKNPLIARIVYPPHPVNGKLENLYYLTSHGVKFLIDELGYIGENIKYPKNLGTLLFRDYYHRVNTIKFQVYLCKWLDNNSLELNFLYSYYDKTGGNRVKGAEVGKLTAKTKIELDAEIYILPDCIFSITAKNKPYLFLMEMHQGKDTGKLLNQIRGHRKALETGRATTKFNLDVGARSLFIFELEATKQAVLNRINEINDISEYKDYFLFKTLDEVESNFFSNWTRPDKKTIYFI